MFKYIDPPKGWLFGFPKQIPEDVVDVHKWLIDNGYPEKLIKYFGDNFQYRIWYQGDDE